MAARGRAGQGREGSLAVCERLRALAVLWGQLHNPLLLLLLAAAGVSGLTGDPTDAMIIAVIVALSVGLGFVNEYRAAMAVEQLHERIRRQAVVWRDGRQRNVDVTQLVPGDVAKALFYRAHGARPAVPGTQPSIPRAQAATDTRSVRRLHRRAAPFIVHALTGPGQWFLRPAGSDGKDTPTSASAGSDHRAGASHQ